MCNLHLLIYTAPMLITFTHFYCNCIFWEQRRLGDHAYIKGRLGWKNLKQNEYTDDGPKMIAGRHIKDGEVDWSLVDHIPLWRYEESPEIMLQNDDIIFSKDGTLGNPALIKDLTSEATINATMMLVRMENTITPYFLFQILNSNIFQRLIHLKVSGSSIPHLFQADMNKFKFYTPSLDEQNKITSLLEIMDHMITLYQRKVSLLLKLSKTLKIIIFSDFKYFKEEKLGDIVKWYKGSGYPKSILSSRGEFNVIHYSELFFSGPILETIKYKSNIEEGIEIPIRSLLFPMSDVTPSGLATVSTINQSNVRAGGDILIGVPSKNICNEYLAYFINTFSNNILRYVTGTTIKHVNAKDLSNLKIVIPDLNSQKNIANTLILLDNNISYLKLKIDKFVLLKQLYILKMFL